MDIPFLGADAASLIDSRFFIAAVALFFGGLVRGFSGFGGAMIFLPVAALLYGPVVAAVIFLMIDFSSALPVLLRAWRVCQWRDVLPIAAGAILMQPLGVLVLVQSDPIIIRFALSIMVLVLVVITAAGWRYGKQMGLAPTFSVGLIAGFSSGAVGMGGPPVVIFWLGGAASAAVVRANIFTFFGIIGCGNFANFQINGLFNVPVVVLALSLVAFYALSLRLGARRFEGISDQVYRKIALVIVTVAALVGLPIWG